MAPRVYATEADYLTFTGEDTAPAKIGLLLRAASRVVDMMLRGVVYDVDPVTKLPTDPDVVDTLEVVVCVIAEEAVTQGLLEPGATGEWENVKIGNVSLSGPVSGGGADLSVAGLPVPALAQLLLAEVGAFTVLS